LVFKFCVFHVVWLSANDAQRYEIGLALASFLQGK